jgi:hypothetical protein
MAATAPSPAARWRPLLVRLGVLAGAVALGLVLQGVLADRLAAISRSPSATCWRRGATSPS